MNKSKELEPVMGGRQLEDYLYEVFPQLLEGKRRPYTIETIAPGRATLNLNVSAAHQRPGGTVSGPAMMALADLALYAAILAHIGPVPLAVTTSLNFNFLRKPDIADLRAEAVLLKLGKRLAVGEITIYSGTANIVTHATGTYSIPDRRASSDLR